MDIATGLAAASAALATVRKLSEIEKQLSQAELKLQVASLYSDLADVRMALTDARETIGGLQAEIDKRDGWNETARLYNLSEVAPGVLVYQFDGADQSIPAHFLCPHCFLEERRSILQREARSAMRLTYLCCPSCDLELKVQGSVTSTVAIGL